MATWANRLYYYLGTRNLVLYVALQNAETQKHILCNYINNEEEVES